MIYWDAEPGLTSSKTQTWRKRQKKIAHNNTLRHAPEAERMIGYIKNQSSKSLGARRKSGGRSSTPW